MKKFLMIGVCSAALATTATAGHWYAGAGVGWLGSNYTAKTGVFDNSNNIQEKKDTISSNAFMGGIFSGYTFKRSSFDLGVEMGLYMDGSKDTLSMKVPNPGAFTNYKSISTAIKRPFTLKWSGKISKEFKGIRGSLTMGILLSKFEITMNAPDDTTPAHSYSKTHGVYTWGIAPGFGVEKSCGAFDVGVNYAYNIYDKIKVSGINVNQDSVFTHAKPRYHSVLLSVKRSF